MSMSSRTIVGRSFLILLLGLAVPDSATARAPEEADVVVYGGTSGGVAAAVQARRMGKTVVAHRADQAARRPDHRRARADRHRQQGRHRRHLARVLPAGRASTTPTRRVEVAEPRAVPRTAARPRTAAGEDTMWTFEPRRRAEDLQRPGHASATVAVVYGERLDRAGAASKKDGRADRRHRDGVGQTFAGRMFIDATYEGDLMAEAGVSYTVGREANDQYGETLNGVQTKNAKHHQFRPGVDPYVTQGRPVERPAPRHRPRRGRARRAAATRRVQAYCFRMCLTDHPGEPHPLPQARGLRRARYELLLRNFEAGETGHAVDQLRRCPTARPTPTTARGVSTDFIGQNYDYPEASYAERERIVARPSALPAGPDVDAGQRPARAGERSARRSRAGACARTSSPRAAAGRTSSTSARPGGWSADYVMTQHDCQGRDGGRRPGRPGRLHDGLAQHPAVRRRRRPRPQRGQRRGRRLPALPDQLPGDRAEAARSARTCWCRSASPPRTSPTARSAWSRSSWSSASPPRPPPAWRSTRRSRCRRSTTRSCASGCWPTSRSSSGKAIVRVPAPPRAADLDRRAIRVGLFVAGGHKSSLSPSVSKFGRSTKGRDFDYGMTYGTAFRRRVGCRAAPVCPSRNRPVSGYFCGASTNSGSHGSSTAPHSCIAYAARSWNHPAISSGVTSCKAEPNAA